MDLCIGATRLSRKPQHDAATESVLVERCRRRDDEAFGRLVDAYHSRVFGFVRRMTSGSQEAEDVTQEVFVRAYTNFPHFDARSSVRTWLFRIAHNLCVDRARKAERAPAADPLVDSEHGETIDLPDERWRPEALVLDSELVGVIEGAIETMSEKLRAVLLLHDREDLAYEEIARAVGVPVGTVKSRLFLARAHLQRVVGEYLKGDEPK